MGWWCPGRLVVVVLLGWLPGCAATMDPGLRPAIVSEQIASAVARAQQVEIDLYAAGKIGAFDHALWQRKFLALGQWILAANEAIRSRSVSGREVALRAMLEHLDEMQSVLLLHLESEQARLWLTTSLEVIRGVVIAMSVQEVSWTRPLLQPCFG